MKPPQKEAVAEALSILMGSVNKENDSQFVSQETQAVFASLSSLPDNVEALTIIKGCIDKELEKLISSLQHRRNLAAPIHKLPVEVLVMIFAHFTASSSLSDDHNLLGLTTVNKLWYDAIVHSPQLWTVIESDCSPKIANLVVQQSKNLPLSLIWDNTGCDKSKQPKLAEILELLVHNSARLKSVKMTVPGRSEPGVRRLLESNMPRLEKLQVKAVWDRDTEGESLEEFELLDGPPLKEISLNKTRLSSWSSPRLSGLVALDITTPYLPPSIEELWGILSNSTQLERLKLRGWYRSPFPWKPLSDRPITLPHLKDFHVESIDHDYFVALLASVYTPSTRSVMIDTRFGSNRDLLEKVCALATDQLVALLGLGNSGSHSPGTPALISIWVDANRLEIEKNEDNKKRSISIGSQADHAAQVMGLLERFFLPLPQPLEVELSIGDEWKRGTPDLLPWGRSLRKLSAHSPVICRAVLQQLAQETIDPTTGVTSWVCPNLTSIRLLYFQRRADEEAELDGVALEALVRARWSNKAAVEQLSEFTIRCQKEKYPSIWSRATFLKESIPCLALLDLQYV